MKKSVRYLSLLVIGGCFLVGGKYQAAEAKDFFTISAPSINTTAGFKENYYNLNLDLLHQYGVWEKDKAKTIEEIHEPGETDFYSLEGFQNFTNLKNFRIILSNVTDLYVFSEMKNLEKIEEFYTQIPISDLTPISNLYKLKQLNLNLGKLEDHDNYRPREINTGKRNGVTDLTPLNSLNNLEKIEIQTQGYYPSVKLSKRDNRYELLDPITLSKHFKTKVSYYNLIVGREDEYDYEKFYDGGNVINSKLVWKNIPTNTDYLEFEARSDDNSSFDSPYKRYYGKHRIPIIWVD